MKKSIIAATLAIIAIICVYTMGSSGERNPIGLGTKSEISHLNDRQDLAPTGSLTSEMVPGKVSSASRAGVYSSEKIEMKVTLTDSGDLIFEECDPWVELDQKRYALEKETLTFVTANGQYYVDFLDPDPRVLTLSRRLKPYAQPPKREYIQLRLMDVAK